MATSIARLRSDVLPTPVGNRRKIGPDDVEELLESGTRAADLPRPPVSIEAEIRKWLNALKQVGTTPAVQEELLYAKILPMKPRDSYSVSIRAEWSVENASVAIAFDAIKAAIEKAVRHPVRFGSETIESLADTAMLLEQVGHLEAAIDLIHERVDGLFRSGRFADCDALLKNTDPSRLSDDIIMSLLTATLPGHPYLPSRHEFVRSAEQALRGRGTYEAGLLDGLYG